MATNAELVDIMEGTWRSVMHLCESLGDGEWSYATGCPGWSVKDIVSHVAGLESELLGNPVPDVVSRATGRAGNLDGPAFELSLRIVTRQWSRAFVEAGAPTGTPVDVVTGGAGGRRLRGSRDLGPTGLTTGRRRSRCWRPPRTSSPASAAAATPTGTSSGRSRSRATASWVPLCSACSS